MTDIKNLICCSLCCFAAIGLLGCKNNVHQEPTEISPTLFNIREIVDDLYKNGEQDSAIRYLDRLTSPLQLTAVDHWSILNTKTAYFLRYKRMPDSALKYADSLVKVVKDKPRLLSHYISALFLRGDVLMDLGLYDDAFDVYVRGDKISQAKARCFTMAKRIGFLRYRQGAYQAAIPYLKTGFQEQLQCGNPSSFEESFVSPQGVLNTLGVCFDSLKQPDSALFYYHKALSFIEERKNKFPEKKNFPFRAQGVIYGNMANVFIQKGKLGQAEQYLLKSIEINDKKGFEVGDAQEVKVRLISLYSDNGQYQKAGLLIKAMDHPNAFGSKERSPELILKFHQVKWKYYERIHDTEKAYLNLERFHVLNDSIETASKGQRYVDVEHGLKDADKAQMIQLLKKDAQSKKLLIVGAIILIILIFVILYIVLRNLKHTRANIAKLNVSKSQIQSQYVQLTQVFSVLEKSHNENATIMKVVAHDLRGPVSGIIHAAKLMLEDGSLSEINLHMLHLVRDAGSNALSLINEILNTHQGLGEVVPTDIYTLLNDSSNLLHFKAEAKLQKIQISAEHIVVLVNKDKISRVINNLIINAIKFSSANDTITIATARQEQEVVVSIADQGVGIPAHMGDRIFEMFSDNGRVGTAAEESFGMGLAISKQIIESHGGRIWYTSTEGLGTTFYFSLPL